MSTSLLYHGFRIHGYQYVNSRYQKGAVIFTIDCYLRLRMDPAATNNGPMQKLRVLRDRARMLTA